MKYLLTLLLFFLLLPVNLHLVPGSNFCFAKEKQIDPDTLDTLRVVLVPEKNVFEQRKRYQYITDYLSEKMGLNFTVEIMSNYGNISEIFVEGEADAGFFGSFSYVLTHAKAGIEPIARPVWPHNNSTYRGYIFVRKDSNINSVEDMKNRSLVLVDKATTAGYIYPLYYFQYSGINNMEDYFSRIYYSNSHDAAAWAVYTGEADIGCAKDTIYKSLLEEHPDFKKQMLVLTESPEVPSNGLAVRKDLHPAIKLLIKTLLLSMHESPEGRKVLEDFGAIRFIETNNEDYRVLNDMVKQLGINLDTYSYKNKSLLE
ncbi:phosphate/phosphite/phosphonate ABC transporter substrate-binding protein [Thermodesulfobacteriota bacterium]